MISSYTQKFSTIQKVACSKASSLLDSSSQSESLQRKADMVNAATQRAEVPRPNNTGMPDNLKAGIESLSGYSMDDVRVHYNSSKPATVQALAYTQGTDIHVAPGQEKCLPHEAWHVAQQMAGRVSPTTNINGMPVNDNAALEHEADVMGEKAVQCEEYACQKEKKQCCHTPIQCYRKENGYVFSQTEKFAVKENEASTIYLNKNKSDKSVENKLKSLGICIKVSDSSVLEKKEEVETNKLKNLAICTSCTSGSIYDIYEQVEPVIVDKPRGSVTDSEADLNEQYFFVKKLIVACHWLRGIPNEMLMPKYLRDFVLTEFTTEPYILHLGDDVKYAYYLIKKWIVQPNQVDETTLNVVLGDLELRLSQIEQELNNVNIEYCGMKTECGASDQQRRRALKSKENFGVDIKTVDESKEYLVRWDNHYSTQIGEDGDDVLCIEDASGKSGGSNHLAKAHWFARIYGRPNQDTTPLEKSDEQTFNIPVPELYSDRLSGFKLLLTSKPENTRKLEVFYKDKSFYYNYEGALKSKADDDFLLQTAYSVLNGVLVRLCFTEEENYVLKYGPNVGKKLYQEELGRRKKN
ncbi:MAG: DUF4157 domain-containing protein [Fibrobacter sp.]|nr:DUF4157 domain-containing protein [Fibrobacter sp.]